jgi:hypothetical protein
MQEAAFSAYVSYVNLEFNLPALVPAYMVVTYASAVPIGCNGCAYSLQCLAKPASPFESMRAKV